MKRSASSTQADSHTKKPKSSTKSKTKSTVKSTAVARSEELAYLKQVVGDAIKDGLRVQTCRALLESGSLGELCFFPVSRASFRWLVQPGSGSSSLPDDELNPIKLTKPTLAQIFGATKIQKGGSREERYDCGEAIFTWTKSRSTLFDDNTGELEVTYTPQAMGTGKQKNFDFSLAFPKDE